MYAKCTNVLLIDWLIDWLIDCPEILQFLYFFLFFLGEYKNTP